jgi:hypothetical protein
MVITGNDAPSPSPHRPRVSPGRWEDGATQRQTAGHLLLLSDKLRILQLQATGDACRRPSNAPPERYRSGTSTRLTRLTRLSAMPPSWRAATTTTTTQQQQQQQQQKSAASTTAASSSDVATAVATFAVVAAFAHRAGVLFDVRGAEPSGRRPPARSPELRGRRDRANRPRHDLLRPTWCWCGSDTTCCWRTRTWWGIRNRSGYVLGPIRQRRIGSTWCSRTTGTPRPEVRPVRCQPGIVLCPEQPARTVYFTSHLVRMGDMLRELRCDQELIAAHRNERVKLQGLRVKVLGRETEDGRLFPAGCQCHVLDDCMKQLLKGEITA